MTQTTLFGKFVIRASSTLQDGRIEWAGWLMNKSPITFSDNKGDLDHAISWLVKDHAEEYALFLRHKLKRENLDIRVVKVL